MAPSDSPVPKLSLPSAAPSSHVDDGLGKPPLDRAGHPHHHHHDATGIARPKGYWDKWQTRAGTVSLLFSMLMQLSYVAFPAYNFSLAIWATVHPFSHRVNPQSTILFVFAMLVSCGTDVVWSSLWTSGAVFYDMLCSPGQIGILHCDGLQSYPGCATNRFVMVVFVANIALKLWMAISIWRAVAVAKPDAVAAMEPVHAPPPPGTVVADAAAAVPVE
ncbi:hypothetical protein H310_02178 [Aphanomyces invadans]|uniref:Uncharacterized protein n=1 Tax=Aphanomyces invadans TaxID=157072 RepID=A0A024UMP2_9STRA|nr:hypothetical protein H310_02178 [Aphanomyces invadans]ETW07731.1 hypothetical protein H310_02178 [Aphanomyces invadans]|eukprot:XP_008863824.1 hypothetical protein H310_02178 [Aphanomyces invadans]